MSDQVTDDAAAIPRLGFLGVGWIGRDRMLAIAASGVARVCAVADTNAEAAASAAADVGATVVAVDDLVTWPGLDGVVIATPSALHAAQSIAALDAGRAVFCQKPLGRNAVEAAAVVAAARRCGRRLGVDLSYRHLDATQRMREIVLAGEIGTIFAADLVFHNAYGPDKPWFTDRALSGGGCVIDLGTHLIDLARWMLPGEQLAVRASALHAKGRRLNSCSGEDHLVEDHAVALLDTPSGAVVSVACSWHLHAGRDAVIAARFHGTTGSVELSNVGGSFYDFDAFLHRGTSSQQISRPPDAWSGRSAVDWATRVAAGEATADAELDDLVAVAEVVDGIYGR